MVAIGSSDTMKEKKFLDANFSPSEWDVLCGRGKECFNWSGNHRFRLIVDRYLEEYQQATTKLKKSMIVADIVDYVRLGNPREGGFIRKSNGCWYEIGDEAAREKVGQTIRDALIAQDPDRLARKRRERAIRKVKRQISGCGSIKTCSTSSLDPTPFPTSFLPLIRAASGMSEHSYAREIPHDDADEILASTPPVLAYGTSREWVKDLIADSDSDSLSVSSDGFDEIFNNPVKNHETAVNVWRGFIVQSFPCSQH